MTLRAGCTRWPLLWVTGSETSCFASWVEVDCPSCRVFFPQGDSPGISLQSLPDSESLSSNSASDQEAKWKMEEGGRNRSQKGHAGRGLGHTFLSLSPTLSPLLHPPAPTGTKLVNHSYNIRNSKAGQYKLPKLRHKRKEKAWEKKNSSNFPIKSCTKLDTPYLFVHLHMFPPQRHSTSCGCKSRLRSTACVIIIKVLSDEEVSPSDPTSSSQGDTLFSLVSIWQEYIWERSLWTWVVLVLLFLFFTGNREGVGREELTQAELSLLPIYNHVRWYFSHPKSWTMAKMCDPELKNKWKVK